MPPLRAPNIGRLLLLLRMLVDVLAGDDVATALPAVDDDKFPTAADDWFGWMVVATVDSLHDDMLDSLPCDGVSETRLCVSSKPSSLS